MKEQRTFKLQTWSIDLFPLSSTDLTKSDGNDVTTIGQRKRKRTRVDQLAAKTGVTRGRKGI
jgi:hypothetical protein